MRIFALQPDNDIRGIEQRKLHIEQLVAALDRPDLVVLPELALCAYQANSDIWQCADADGADAAAFAKMLAARYHCCIGIGFVEQSGGEFYNSYLIADSERVFGTVRKCEGESYCFCRGDFPHLISTPFGMVAVAICYDAHRRHFYDSIRDQAVSLILMPHASPCDPQLLEREFAIRDELCSAYAAAFRVPVLYANSTGELGQMQGRIGAMMMQAGFTLSGGTKIYSSSGRALESASAEAVGWEVELAEQRRSGDIRFYGQDIRPGNWLFRHTVLPWDVRRGQKYYQREHGKHLR